MEKLLTKIDLANRWQVSEQTIDGYKAKRIIAAVKGLPSVRFNSQHIAEIEETKLDRFSPLERRKLEGEIVVLKLENKKLNEILSNILAEVAKIIRSTKSILKSK